MTTAAFGFGIGATGGSGTPVTVKNRDELANALRSKLDGKIIELAAGTYDFTDLKKQDRTFTISGDPTTIRGRAGASVVVKNFQFIVNLDVRNRILIENIAFRSNGTKSGTRDGMDLVATVPGDNDRASREVSSMRITQCSFDGYLDISIDSHNIAGRPALLVTVDHCLFFDSHPGQYGFGDTSFKDRGAVNIDVARKTKKAARKPGNSKYTVANNVFLDVWRRSPRVAEKNFAHVYNNLLYRWGFTAPDSPDPKNKTWRGMEVGGGNSGGDKKEPNGTAII
ncbi:MAG: hypothetical protein JO197_04010 [Acidobacteria bacterium]|nr:hypothetical protein [Acidobacteriota bacterium]MBV9476449.1 hypothetical protein [Acidobacteriota bacterium]